MSGGLIRQTTVLFLVLAVGLVLVLFAVKYQVQDLEAELSRLDADIVSERRSVHVLRAEWGHLTDPGRLQGLADRHLDLVPLQPHQLASFAALPPALPSEESVEMYLRALEGGAPPTLAESSRR